MRPAPQMTNTELCAELREMDNVILSSKFTAEDVARHESLSAELLARGYSIKRRTVLDIEKSDNPTFL